MHPKTDIICLVHNQLDTTKKFVQHLFDNTENFNLIFVNNGSDESTTQWLNNGETEGKWCVINAIENGKLVNLGIIKGRNLGAKHITCDYFLNIDNDQFVQKYWLEQLHLKMSEGYDIVGCEAWKMFPPDSRGVIMIGNTVIKDKSYYPHKRCTNKHDKFTYIGCGGMLIKRSVYEKIGLFDERFNVFYFEDPDFAFRSIQAGFKLGWCPECNIVHLAHQTIGNQKMFDKQKQFLQSWNRFKEKWNGWFPNTDRRKK